MIAITLHGGELDGHVKQIAAPYLPKLLWFAPFGDPVTWMVIGTDRNPPDVPYGHAGVQVYGIDADDEVSMARGLIAGRATYTLLRGQQ